MLTSIRARTMAATAVLILSLSAGLAVIFFGTEGILRDARSLYERDFLSMNRLIEADRDAYQAKTALLQLLLLRGGGEADKFQGEIAENRKQTEERFADFVKLSGVSHDLDAVRRFSYTHGEWSRETDGILELAASGDYDGAAARFFAWDNAAAFDDMRGTLDGLTEISLKNADASYSGMRSRARTVTTALAAAAAVIVLSLLALVLVIFRGMLKPLARTTELMREIASGEADLTRRLDVRRDDEIGRLSRHFNDFLAGLAGIVGRIVGVSREARTLQNDVAAGTSQSTAAVTQIAANIEAMKSRAGALESSVDSTAGSIRTIGGSVRELKERITSQAAMVEESSAAIVEMTASINNAADVASRRLASFSALDAVIGEGTGAVNNNAEAIARITGSIASIREITDIISSVASQTNLLAMNAAIEAAHAGAAGKGFAVVAGEIRKLAESAAAQSKGISSLLKQIIGDIRSAEEAGTRTSSSFRGLTDHMVDLKSALEDIAAGMDELRSGGTQINEAMTGIQSITGSVSEHAAGIESSQADIAADTENVRQLTGNIVGGMQEIAAGASQISGAMNELTESTASLTGLVDALDSQVGRFTIGEKEK